MSSTPDVRQRVEAAFPRLSARKREAARFIAANTDEVAFLTAADVARRVGVSESLIVRLTRDLGFRGYTDLQEACQALMRGQLGKVDLFERGVSLAHGDEVNVVVRRDLQNIRATMRYNSTETIERAADMLAQARRVRVIAGRTSAGPGIILAIYLNELLGDVELVTPGFGDMFDNLRKLGEDDLAIAISFSHYTKTTIDAARYVKARGCKLVAITDPVGSPLAQIADLTLAAEAKGVSFAVSHAGVVVLTNVLIYAVGLRKRDTVRHLLREADEVFHDYIYYERRSRGTAAARSDSSLPE